MKHCSSGQRATVPGTRWSQLHFHAFSHSIYPSLYLSLPPSPDTESFSLILFPSPGVQFSQESLDLSERGIPGNTVLRGGANQPVFTLHLSFGIKWDGIWRDCVSIFYYLFILYKRNNRSILFDLSINICGATSSFCMKHVVLATDQ